LRGYSGRGRYAGSCNRLERDVMRISGQSAGAISAEGGTFTHGGRSKFRRAGQAAFLALFFKRPEETPPVNAAADAQTVGPSIAIKCINHIRSHARAGASERVVRY